MPQTILTMNVSNSRTPPERSKQMSENVEMGLFTNLLTLGRRRRAVGKKLTGVGGLQNRILAMMRGRGWDLRWQARAAHLFLECSELVEAVRGKHGDTLEESADVLMTLLAISPHTLPEIVSMAAFRADALKDRPRYPGEEFEPSAEEQADE
jgi:hypothetical protein